MQLFISRAQNSKPLQPKAAIQPFQLDSKQGSDNIWVIADYLEIFPCSPFKVSLKNRNNNKIA